MSNENEKSVAQTNVQQEISESKNLTEELITMLNTKVLSDRFSYPGLRVESISEIHVGDGDTIIKGNFMPLSGSTPKKFEYALSYRKGENEFSQYEEGDFKEGEGYPYRKDMGYEEDRMLKFLKKNKEYFNAKPVDRFLMDLGIREPNDFTEEKLCEGLGKLFLLAGYIKNLPKEMTSDYEQNTYIGRNSLMNTFSGNIDGRPYLLRYTTEGLYFFEYEERYFIKDEEITPTNPIEKLIKEFTLEYITDLFKKHL